MADTGYLAGFIAVAAVATFLTRVIPFLFFQRHTEHPLVRHLGRYLPAAVMALLATVFLQRSATWNSSLPGLDALLPAILVVVVHLWRRNALLSIASGTIAYMAILQLDLIQV
ncbi:branched-chain amino acid transporter [Marinobacter panjinensis]|uniref:Branched-chain amino acid transporter n=1 Tax=Marinobacter panjinensis TaxID=2576384 RepID=A0A4U6R0G5_9GAMM|nr:AzlD domain-containing protein [Marinobacter panjinensis]MCR8915638.1 AzlD domain-containing protein [Marinobacter panjinensis]TKV66883.1 branched-chain amino acid transporter [Marinobacter panjinensis]